MKQNKLLTFDIIMFIVFGVLAFGINRYLNKADPLVVEMDKIRYLKVYGIFGISYLLIKKIYLALKSYFSSRGK